MVASRSALTTRAVRDGLRGVVDPVIVDVGATSLRDASLDRFKKYPAVHGIHDGPVPAAIVRARSTADVVAVLGFADAERVNVVPRTGGTGTEGGLETVVEDTIVLDCSAMDEILDINEDDMTATVQCGVPLRVLEDALRARGLTTGHSPQSTPIAQYGGLVATRSIGQLSTLYGAIEDMVLGLEAVFAGGRIARIRNVPRRAAGPDLRHLVIGTEGALCVITEVTVKVFRHRPGTMRFFGCLVDDFATGVDALRELVTDGYRPSVCRVYSPEDARQHFAHFSRGKCVVVLVAEGPGPIAAATAGAIEDLFAGRPHERVDPHHIRTWFENLNWGPDRIEAERASMLSTSHLGYTTEVSANWSRVGELYEAVMARVRSEFPRISDLTMLGAHSSHSYQTGTNLYFVYDYTVTCPPREEIAEYHVPLNAIIVEEALRVGGSMVHHHGVGKYRTPWIEQEHGSSYWLLTTLKDAFDPHGVMNAATLLPIEESATGAAGGRW